MRHKFKIAIDADGAGCALLDGQRLAGVVSVGFFCGENQAPTVTLKFVACEVELDTETEIVTDD